MRRPALMAWLAATASLAAASPAHALLCGTFLDPLTISTSNLAFGDYKATDLAAKANSGTITLSCAIALDVLPNFTVALSAGTSGGYATRKMALGSNRLNYNLYTTAGHATVWGDGTAGTVTQAYTSNLLQDDIAFTVYGLLPAGQWSHAGFYQDTVVITVTF